MEIRHTPPLSREGMEEIIEEMKRPPADTPERRATFARARAAGALVQQVLSSASHPKQK
jgi:hypothetical protein